MSNNERSSGQGGKEGCAFLKKIKEKKIHDIDHFEKCPVQI